MQEKPVPLRHFGTLDAPVSAGSKARTPAQRGAGHPSRLPLSRSNLTTGARSLCGSVAKVVSKEPTLLVSLFLVPSFGNLRTNGVLANHVNGVIYAVAEQKTAVEWDPLRGVTQNNPLAVVFLDAPPLDI